MNKLQSTKAAILSTLLIGAISFTLASCSGDDGSDGATGAKGETGATGAAGEAGAKGDKGDTGAGCTVADDGKIVTITCGTNVTTYRIGYDYEFINGAHWMTEDLEGTYTWEQAQKACPAGWRLPTTAEGKAAITASLDFFEVERYWSSEETSDEIGLYYVKKTDGVDDGSSPKTSITPKVRCVKY